MNKINLSVLVISVALSSGMAAMATAETAARMIGPDICKGRLWIKHMAAIQATSVPPMIQCPAILILTAS
jgi:hypothetical protein